MIAPGVSPGIKAPLKIKAREAGDRILRPYKARNTFLLIQGWRANCGRLPLATLFNRYAVTKTEGADA